MKKAVLGASLALTGPEAVYARQLHEALQLALESLSRAVVLHVEDDASEEERARVAAERLVSNEGVFAVIGPMNSWTAEVQAPIFEKARLAHVTPSASKPDLSRQGWRSFFRMCANDLEQGRVLAGVARELLGASSVGAVHDGTSFGEPLAKVFLEECAQNGLSVSCLQSVRRGEEASIVAAAESAARANADALLVVGLEEPCRDVAREMRRIGVNSVFLGTDAIKPTKVLVAPGFDGPYLTNAGTHAANRAPEFHRRFESRFGTHHSVYTVEAFDAARALVQVMNEVGPDRSRVLDLLRVIRHEGASGAIRFDECGERCEPEIEVYRCEGGNLRYLGTSGDVLARGTAPR